MMRRRDVLRSLILISFAGEVAGCGAESVRVAVAWSGWELTQFQRVVRAYPGARIDVLSAGDDMPTLLTGQVAALAAPDVAMVSEPGAVRANRRRLLPLGTPPDVPADWQRLLTFDQQIYGNWFKVAHKSIVWYDRDRSISLPGDWDSWVNLCKGMAKAGNPPLAIGAADGWVLADWFSNVLLSVDPILYRQFVSGRRDWGHQNVKATLRRLVEIWGIPGVFPGGAERALVTQADESAIDVFLHRNAAMVAGADFYYSTVKQFGDVSRAGWFQFPHRPEETKPLVIGGDAAVLLKTGSSRGRELIDWLTQHHAAQTWARQGGLLSLDPAVTGYPAPLAELAAQVRSEVVDFGFFDELSDRLPVGDGQGSWKILQDFFAAVAERGGPGPEAEAAIDRAVKAFGRADQGAG